MKKIFLIFVFACMALNIFAKGAEDIISNVVDNNTQAVVRDKTAKRTTYDVWLKTFHNDTAQAYTSEQQGFDSSGKGIIGGIDKLVWGKMFAGIAYSNSSLDVKSGDRKSDIDNNTVLLYAICSLQKTFLSIGGGYTDSFYEEKGERAGSLFTARHGGHQTLAFATLGYKTHLEKIIFVPLAGVSYNSVYVNSYSDSSGQTYNSASGAIWTFKTGAKMAYPMPTKKINFILRLTLNATYDWSEENMTRSGFLPGGSSYVIADSSFPFWGLNTDAGIDFMFKKSGIILSLDYQNVRKQWYNGNTYLATLRYSF